MLDFNYLRTGLELLVLWGIYPYLEAGVGVAMEKRAETKAVMVSRGVQVWGMVVEEEWKKERGRGESVEEGEEERVRYARVCVHVCVCD
jgi:hypothetical protein